MSSDPETLGVHYHTWRNVIAKESLDEKSRDDDFDSAVNPEPIPPLMKHRYQDQNFIQVVQPLQVFRPITLAGGTKKVMQKNGFLKDVIDPVEQGLKGIVFTAARKGLKVKAVGSGHSFSDIATTSDYLVVTDDLNEMLTRKQRTSCPNIRHADFLKSDLRTKGYPSFIETHVKTGSSSRFYGDPKENPGLVEFEAGIKIASLNEQLWDLEWSLYNMGTYQGQSFIGAASTATHGSGHTLPPLPDMIRSMVIVADHGLVLRIEPKTGITQAGALAHEKDFTGPFAEGFKDLIGKRIFKSQERNVDFLIQDDDWFASTLVNVGTFGLVYSVIIEVIPRYYLLETVEYSTWEDVRERLKNQNTYLIRDQSSVIDDGQHELLEKKEFTAHFPADKELECDDNDLRSQLSVSEIRQTTIEIHPHKIKDGSNRGQNLCRIMRQYRVPYGPFAKRWAKKKKGRLSGPFLDAINIDIIKGSLNVAWENVKHNEDEQQEWYEKNANLTAVALLRPVSGDLIESVTEVLLRQKERIAEVFANAPEEPNCREHYLNRNYNTQFIPLFPGYGVELGFTTRPLKDFDNLPGYIAAMDRILQLAEQHWTVGRYMQSSPLALRMVKASNAYLAMQYSDTNEPTCMIELLNQSDTHGGKELFYRYERELFKYGARPHWGLDLSVTTGNNNLLTRMYPKFAEWFKVYKALNYSGTFNNRFTGRMGLSGQPFAQD